MHRDEQSDALQRRIGERIREARHDQGLSLAQLGGSMMSRGFLSSVEHGRSGISFAGLAAIATRLNLPMGYFLDEVPERPRLSTLVTIDHARAALGYSLYLRSRGETEDALEYALWAAQARLAGTEMS